MAVPSVHERRRRLRVSMPRTAGPNPERRRDAAAGPTGLEHPDRQQRAADPGHQRGQRGGTTAATPTARARPSRARRVESPDREGGHLRRPAPRPPAPRGPAAIAARPVAGRARAPGAPARSPGRRAGDRGTHSAEATAPSRADPGASTAVTGRGRLAGAAAIELDPSTASDPERHADHHPGEPIRGRPASGLVAASIRSAGDRGRAPRIRRLACSRRCVLARIAAGVRGQERGEHDAREPEEDEHALADGGVGPGHLQRVGDVVDEVVLARVRPASIARGDGRGLGEGPRQDRTASGRTVDRPRRPPARGRSCGRCPGWPRRPGTAGMTSRSNISGLTMTESGT